MKILFNGQTYSKLDVTKEQIAKINEIADAFRGTLKYGHYEMSVEGKNEKGKWFYMGYSHPIIEEDSFLKIVKNNVYLMQKQGSIDYSVRYTVTKEIMDLFGWEVTE